VGVTFWNSEMARSFGKIPIGISLSRRTEAIWMLAFPQSESSKLIVVE